MKTMNFILTGLMSASFVANSAHAATAAEIVASPVEALQKERAELAELKTQLAEQERLQKFGYIAIGISTTAAVGGLFSSIGEGLADMGVNIIKEVTTQEVQKVAPKITLSNIIFIGGATGAVGSTIYVLVKASDVKKLKSAIDIEEQKIDSLLGQLAAQSK